MISIARSSGMNPTLRAIELESFAALGSANESQWLGRQAARQPFGACQLSRGKEQSLEPPKEDCKGSWGLLLARDSQSLVSAPI